MGKRGKQAESAGGTGNARPFILRESNGQLLMPAVKRFGIIDIVIILLMICGIFMSSKFLILGHPSHIAVFRQNTLIAKYPLNDSTTFTVSGKNGPLDIEIKDKTVKILHANCPRQICKRSGEISGAHGKIICAPNNILIRINYSKSSPGNENNVDAVAY
jgi:hypothetical protein